VAEEAPTSGLWRNPNFMRLWVGETLSTLGSRMSYVAYPLLVLATTGSPAKAGGVGFLRMLPWLVFSLPAGVVSDRVDRKRLMIACDLCACLTIASVPVALALDALTFTQLLAVAFLEGTCAVFFKIAETPVVVRMVASEQLPGAVAQNQAREYGAFLVGPPLGGILFGFGRALPFIADAASYLVSAVALRGIRRPFQSVRDSSSRRAIDEAREGVLWLWREPFLRMSEVLVAGSNLISNALGLSLIVIAREKGASSGEVGVMLALVAAGGLAGAVAAPFLRAHISARLIVAGYCWVGAGAVFALVSTPPALAMGAIFGAWVFFGPLWDAVVMGYRLRIVPDAIQGRVESVGTLISFGAAALGPLAAGLLLDGVGARPTLLAAATAMVLLGVVGTVSRSLRPGLSAVRL
jgi:MFS family permease